MIKYIIRKIQKGAGRARLAASLLFPLQPQNYTKLCNSVTIWKKGEFELNTWLHFLFMNCNQVQKNCNQLRPSFSYKFKTVGYGFVQKLFVTVTYLKFNSLSSKIGWLQNHNFLVLISEQRSTSNPYTKSLIQSII